MVQAFLPTSNRQELPPGLWAPEKYSVYCPQRKQHTEVGRKVWWGNVHENIELDEQGAAFRGSGQGPWQEVQSRTWSAWLFAAPDTGTPVERQGASQGLW